MFLGDIGHFDSMCERCTSGGQIVIVVPSEACMERRETEREKVFSRTSALRHSAAYPHVSISLICVCID